MDQGLGGICLGVVALAAGWSGHRRACALAMPLTFAVCLGANAARGPNDDGLWIVGMVLAYIGTLLGAMLMGVVGELASRLRGARTARRPESRGAQ